MESTEALRSIEIVLRLTICDALGPQWIDAPGAPNRATLEKRRENEAKGRRNVVVPQNLIDYTYTTDLGKLILANWEKFEPVFSDKEQMHVYFEIVARVRNNIAHSRDLTPHERDLISGIAGHIRNQVSMYRSSKGSRTYCPLIESIQDSFGVPGKSEVEGISGSGKRRLDVGTTLTFAGRASDAQGREVEWGIGATNSRELGFARGMFIPFDILHATIGDSVSFDFKITEEHVGESLIVAVVIRAKGARFFRYAQEESAPYDDGKAFKYAVNPPL